LNTLAEAAAEAEEERKADEEEKAGWEEEDVIPGGRTRKQVCVCVYMRMCV